MPSSLCPAIRDYTINISLPLRVNITTNADRPQSKQRICQRDAVVDVEIRVDTEGPSRCDAIIFARSFNCRIGVVFLLSDWVQTSIVSHRVQIPATASLISTLHGRQAIHHLLLGEVQVHVMALHEVALNFSDSCEGPARTTFTLVLDTCDEDVGGLRVVDAEHRRINIVQESSLRYSLESGPIAIFGETALLIWGWTLHKGPGDAAWLAHSSSEVHCSEFLESQMGELIVASRVVLRVLFIVLLDSLISLLVDHSSVGVLRRCSLNALFVLRGSSKQNKKDRTDREATLVASPANSIRMISLELRFIEGIVIVIKQIQKAKRTVKF